MHKPVMIVGEVFDEEDERKGLPFQGPAGSILRGLMRQAGLDPKETHFTNVFNLRPKSNRLESLCGPKETAISGYRALTQGKNGFVQEKYQPELDRLFLEIEQTRPNIIVALGHAALWALCKKSGVKKYRGSPLLTFDEKYKVLPTWHPNNIFRQWELRTICLMDFTKAAREARFPDLIRPSHLLYLEPSIDDIKNFYHEFLYNQPFVSIDIETKAKTITEVGIGTADGSRAIVIPFWSRKNKSGNYWETAEEEKEAWRLIAHICKHVPSIGQNFSYDMQYFWKTLGITCNKFAGDTMLLHHALQPELEKGLGFLASIYTNEPSWKFMRQDHSTLKKGDD